ncbi:uncharacterized protein LOC116766610 [Danaus plexippus]|uniref:uncharacterized protein LOC116766610 n=1 Tax=Danaus plexippus TaxID=13037 RepID=UPI002AB1F56A|nr:uncharacterized protein LOC116766610 [Danaus plexippus]
MPSQSELTDNEDQNPLPPLISCNPRVKLEAEQVSLSNCFKLHKERDVKRQFIDREHQRDPNHPLQITWHPTKLFIEINDSVVVRKLRICNASSRLVYIKSGRFSNEAGRLGAGWCCLARNRFLLAPGIVADIFIKATPREFAPIASAKMTLQLTAAHMRDLAVAFFEVPILVNFLKHIPPETEEDA